MDRIFSMRLKMARLMRGLSMDELCERMNGIVSKQSISKYEQGKMFPNSVVLGAIGDALNLPIDYFFRESLRIEHINFRIDNRIPASSASQMVAVAKDKVERYLILEDLLAVNSDFKNPLKKMKIKTMEDVEKGAELLRQKWNLGMFPIFSVYEILESMGIKVVEFEAGNAHVLGFSTFVNRKIPLLVINLTANTTVERKRFTALHELGHLLLNFENTLSDDICERMCHRFASAVLCPASVFFKELGESRKVFVLEELISLKNRYGISVSAIVYRAKDLGIITSTYYNQIFNQRIHQNRLEVGWGGYPILEHTNRFDRLLYRAVAEQVISWGRAAELANNKLGDFHKNVDVI